MSLKNINNLKKGLFVGLGVANFEAVPCNNASFPIREGSLVWWDSSAHLAKELGVSDDTNAAHLIGVASTPSAVSSSLDGSTEPTVNVQALGVHDLGTTSGDTYHHGDVVYAGADAQTITNTAGMMTNKIGVVQLPAGVASVAGGAGISVPILVFTKAFISLGL